MEKDNSIKGQGNSYDFGARMYDSRLGRWFSVDKLAGKYTSLSPYNFVANNPIYYIDSDGQRILIHYVENGVNKTYEYSGENYYIGTNEYVQDVIAALEQAKAFGGARQIMKVVNDDEILNIHNQTAGDSRAQGPYFDMVSSVYWNAEGGLETRFKFGQPTGKTFSSSRLLFHEVNHAKHKFKNPIFFFIRTRLRTLLQPKYTDFEEKRTIKKENKIFGDEKNQGGKRKTHRGKHSKSKKAVFDPPIVDSPIEINQNENDLTYEREDNIG